MREFDEFDVNEEVNNFLKDQGVRDLDEAKGANSSILRAKTTAGNAMTKLSTAITDPEKEYRQALLLGAFMDREQSSRCAAAIAECQRYGVDIGFIVDRVICDCGAQGAAGGRTELIRDALTHQRLTTNNTEAARRFWDRKKDSGGSNPMQ